MHFFDKAAPDITQEIIDNGVVLAYTKLVFDVTNVRPLPATTENGSVIWNYYITSVGYLKFTSTINNPSPDNEFRHIIIPASNNKVNLSRLSNMSYVEAMTYFGFEI